MSHCGMQGCSMGHTSNQTYTNQIPVTNTPVSSTTNVDPRVQQLVQILGVSPQEASSILARTQVSGGRIA